MLFHHRAEIGCRGWICTSISAFKGRRFFVIPRGNAPAPIADLPLDLPIIDFSSSLCGTQSAVADLICRRRVDQVAFWTTYCGPTDSANMRLAWATPDEKSGTRDDSAVEPWKLKMASSQACVIRGANRGLNSPTTESERGIICCSSHARNGNSEIDFAPPLDQRGRMQTFWGHLNCISSVKSQHNWRQAKAPRPSRSAGPSKS